MIALDLVKAVLADAFRTFERSDGVCVTTHCVYPSNAFVQVMVRAGESTFVVSDDGGALRELEAAGADIAEPDKQLKKLVGQHGLSIYNGVVSAPSCDVAALPVAIALVANVSRDCADWLFAHTKIRRRRDFKLLLRQFIETRFLDRVRPETLTGKSNKPHTFEYLIHLEGGRRVIVDPVVHEANAINARVVANVDVRQADYENLEQRIVYDDEDDWTAEDLNLLQVGAPIIVPVSRRLRSWDAWYS